MPAAAVIPAPIAYIKVVAVKKFVVECLGLATVGLSASTSGSAPIPCGAARGGNIPVPVPHQLL